MTTPIRLLNNIFDQCHENQISSIQNDVKEILRNSTDILIFGAGNNGKRIAQAMMLAGYSPLGFIDDTPDKQGTTLVELPIFSVESAAQIVGKKALVVISIFSPVHSFRRTRQRLSTYGWHCISLLSIGMFFSKEFLPFYFLGNPNDVLNQKKSYQQLFNLLIDDRSRQELLSHLNFRLYLDFDGLLNPIGPNFLYLKDLLPSDVVFIDGGAFDGDTIRAFLDVVKDNFSNIYAFEPDPSNFSKLNAFHKSLSYSIKDKINCINAGLWSKSGSFGFNATATAGSSLSVEASTKSNVIAIDDYFKTNAPFLLKLDVEGAERDVLYGAQTFLESGRAIVVVAVYHQPDDLWLLPKLIHDFNSGYRFGLRSHGDDGTDLMLYAFPPQVP